MAQIPHIAFPASVFWKRDVVNPGIKQDDEIFLLKIFPWNMLRKSDVGEMPHITFSMRGTLSHHRP
jgi:hypothetical protein